MYYIKCSFLQKKVAIFLNAMLTDSFTKLHYISYAIISALLVYDFHENFRLNMTIIFDS